MDGENQVIDGPAIWSKNLLYISRQFVWSTQGQLDEADHYRATATIKAFKRI